MSCINPLTAQLADRETAPTEVRLADTPLVCSRDAVMGASDTLRQGTWKAGTHFARQEGQVWGYDRCSQELKRLTGHSPFTTRPQALS